MIDINTASRDQLLQLIAQMQQKPATKITFKVTAPRTDEKTGKTSGTSGAISVYGLGRFPITLYKSQWDALFAAIPALKAFMTTNASLLSIKD